MRQFDVFENPFARSQGFAPHVAVLSSHLIDLDNVVIAPLFVDRVTSTAVEVAIVISAQPFVLSLLDIASTQPSRLRNRLGDVAAYEDEIRRGLERLFTGF